MPASPPWTGRAGSSYSATRSARLQRLAQTKSGSRHGYQQPHQHQPCEQQHRKALAPSDVPLSAILAPAAEFVQPPGKLAAVERGVTRIDALPEHVCSATTVYLSKNSLTSLDGVQQFGCLRVLSVADNLLSGLADLDVLAAAAPQLEALSLESNPLTWLPHYRAHVVSRFPRLTLLDAKAVTQEERQRASAALVREASCLAVMVSNACLVHKLARVVQLLDLHAELRAVMGGQGSTHAEAAAAAAAMDVPRLLQLWDYEGGLSNKELATIQAALRREVSRMQRRLQAAAIALSPPGSGPRPGLHKWDVAFSQVMLAQQHTVAALLQGVHMRSTHAAHQHSSSGNARPTAAISSAIGEAQQQQEALVKSLARDREGVILDLRDAAVQLAQQLAASQDSTSPSQAPAWCRHALACASPAAGGSVSQLSSPSLAPSPAAPNAEQQASCGGRGAAISATQPPLSKAAVAHGADLAAQALHDVGRQGPRKGGNPSSSQAGGRYQELGAAGGERPGCAPAACRPLAAAAAAVAAMRSPRSPLEAPPSSAKRREPHAADVAPLRDKRRTPGPASIHASGRVSGRSGVCGMSGAALPPAGVRADGAGVLCSPESPAGGSQAERQGAGGGAAAAAAAAAADDAGGVMARTESGAAAAAQSPVLNGGTDGQRGGGGGLSPCAARLLQLACQQRKQVQQLTEQQQLAEASRQTAAPSHTAGLPSSSRQGPETPAAQGSLQPGAPGGLYSPADAWTPGSTSQPIRRQLNFVCSPPAPLAQQPEAAHVHLHIYPGCSSPGGASVNCASPVAAAPGSGGNGGAWSAGLGRGAGEASASPPCACQVPANLAELLAGGAAYERVERFTPAALAMAGGRSPHGGPHSGPQQGATAPAAGGAASASHSELLQALGWVGSCSPAAGPPAGVPAPHAASGTQVAAARASAGCADAGVHGHLAAARVWEAGMDVGRQDDDSQQQPRWWLPPQPQLPPPHQLQPPQSSLWGMKAQPPVDAWQPAPRQLHAEDSAQPLPRTQVQPPVPFVSHTQAALRQAPHGPQTQLPQQHEPSTLQQPPLSPLLQQEQQWWQQQPQQEQRWWQHAPAAACGGGGSHLDLDELVRQAEEAARELLAAADTASPSASPTYTSAAPASALPLHATAISAGHAAAGGAAPAAHTELLQALDLGGGCSPAAGAPAGAATPSKEAPATALAAMPQPETAEAAAGCARQARSQARAQPAGAPGSATTPAAQLAFVRAPQPGSMQPGRQLESRGGQVAALPWQVCTSLDQGGATPGRQTPGAASSHGSAGPPLARGTSTPEVPCQQQWQQPLQQQQQQAPPSDRHLQQQAPHNLLPLAQGQQLQEPPGSTPHPLDEHLVRAASVMQPLPQPLPWLPEQHPQQLQAGQRVPDLCQQTVQPAQLRQQVAAAVESLGVLLQRAGTGAAAHAAQPQALQQQQPAAQPSVLAWQQQPQAMAGQHMQCQLEHRGQMQQELHALAQHRAQLQPAQQSWAEQQQQQRAGPSGPATSSIGAGPGLQCDAVLQAASHCHQAAAASAPSYTACAAAADATVQQPQRAPHGAAAAVCRVPSPGAQHCSPSGLLPPPDIHAVAEPCSLGPCSEVSLAPSPTAVAAGAATIAPSPTAVQLMAVRGPGVMLQCGSSAAAVAGTGPGQEAPPASEPVAAIAPPPAPAHEATAAAGADAAAPQAPAAPVGLAPPCTPPGSLVGAAPPPAAGTAALAPPEATAAAPATTAAAATAAGASSSRRRSPELWAQGTPLLSRVQGRLVAMAAEKVVLQQQLGHGQGAVAQLEQQLQQSWHSMAEAAQQAAERHAQLEATVQLTQAGLQAALQELEGSRQEAQRQAAEKEVAACQLSQMHLELRSLEAQRARQAAADQLAARSLQRRALHRLQEACLAARAWRQLTATAADWGERRLVGHAVRQLRAHAARQAALRRLLQERRRRRLRVVLDAWRRRVVEWRSRAASMRAADFHWRIGLMWRCVRLWHGYAAAAAATGLSLPSTSTSSGDSSPARCNTTPAGAAAAAESQEQLQLRLWRTPGGPGSCAADTVAASTCARGRLSAGLLTPSGNTHPGCGRWQGGLLAPAGVAARVKDSVGRDAGHQEAHCSWVTSSPNGAGQPGHTLTLRTCGPGVGSAAAASARAAAAPSCTGSAAALQALQREFARLGRAQRRHKRALLLRALRAWRLALEQRRQRQQQLERADALARRRRLQGAWHAWRGALAGHEYGGIDGGGLAWGGDSAWAQRLAELLQRRRLARALQRWLLMAARGAAARDRATELAVQRQQQLQLAALTAFREHMRQGRCKRAAAALADSCRDARLRLRAWVAWAAACDACASRQLQLAGGLALQQQRRQQLRASCFRAWQRLVQRRLLADAHAAAGGARQLQQALAGEVESLLLADEQARRQRQQLEGERQQALVQLQAAAEAAEAERRSDAAALAQLRQQLGAAQHAGQEWQRRAEQEAQQGRQLRAALQAAQLAAAAAASEAGAARKGWEASQRVMLDRVAAAEAAAEAARQRAGEDMARLQGAAAAAEAAAAERRGEAEAAEAEAARLRQELASSRQQLEHMAALQQGLAGRHEQATSELAQLRAAFHKVRSLMKQQRSIIRFYQQQQREQQQLQLQMQQGTTAMPPRALDAQAHLPSQMQDHFPITSFVVQRAAAATAAAAVPAPNPSGGSAAPAAAAAAPARQARGGQTPAAPALPSGAAQASYEQVEQEEDRHLASVAQLIQSAEQMLRALVTS